MSNNKAKGTFEALGVIAVVVLAVIAIGFGLLREFGLPAIWLFTPWVGMTWSGKIAPLISVFLFPSSAIVYVWVAGHGGTLHGASRTIFLCALGSDVLLCAGYVGYECRNKGLARAVGAGYMVASRMVFAALWIFTDLLDKGNVDIVERVFAVISLPSLFTITTWFHIVNSLPIVRFCVLPLAFLLDIALDFFVLRDAHEKKPLLCLLTSDGTAYRYAGFWIRAGASAIDFLIMGLVYGAIYGSLTLAGLEAKEDTVGSLTLCVGLAAYCFFTVRNSATPGKMLCGLMTVTAAGGRVGIWRALLRCVGFVIDQIPLYLGFWIAGFDSKKRALHDHIAGTRVVRRSPVALAGDFHPETLTKSLKIESHTAL